MADRKWPLRQMVEVEWLDACNDGGWSDADKHERHEGAYCRTAGYLVKQDRNVVQVALNQSSWSQHIADVMTIPRSCVKRVRRMR